MLYWWRHVPFGPHTYPSRSIGTISQNAVSVRRLDRCGTPYLLTVVPLLWRLEPMSIVLDKFDNIARDGIAESFAKGASAGQPGTLAR